MNFNVHRRNKSLFSQQGKLRDQRHQHSGKKMAPSPEALLQQAKELYYSQTNLQEAVELFQQYLAVHPRHNDALYLCAVALLHLARPDDAIHKLTAISEDYENKPNALLLAAMAFNKLGNVGRSLETVNECIRKYEGFEEALCFRAKIYIGMNFYHKAELDFKTIIATNPAPSFLTFLGLADCHRLQAKPQKALALYHHALETLPKTQQRQTERISLPQEQEIKVKIGVCLWQLEKVEECVNVLEGVAREGVRNSEAFYYLGQAQVRLGKRQQGLLNLEYCLRMQTTQKMARKAYRRLLHLYLEDHQFYQALNVVRLGDIASVDLPWWRRSVEAFMLIIKGNFELGVSELSAVLTHVKASEEQKRTFKIKRDSSDDHSRRHTRYHESVQHKKALLLSPNSKQNQYYYSRDYHSRQKISRKLGYFSTKSVLRAIPKIQSTRLPHPKQELRLKTQERLRTQHIGSQADGPQVEEEERAFSSREKELMMPLLLLFKAYGEFFLGSFMKCLDTYEEYQAFLKDMFGRDSDVAYNKTLTEALLMAESDMPDDALLKFSSCIDLYYAANHSLPQEPLLYKAMLLIRLAIKGEGEESQEQADRAVEGTTIEVLQSTLQLLDNYKEAIGGHFLSHYFRALIYILLGRLEESREALQRTFKVTEECSWRLLYVKGVVEMQLGNFYEAVKEFSAGLILENRAQFYLGRSICFLRLSEKEERQVSEASIQMLMKSVHISSQLTGKKEREGERSPASKTDLLVQNCFQDLQKYIELQNNQEEISLWVSKILFANRAYDEAVRSLTKISKQTPEVLAMMECIEVYEGELENGGAVGAVLRQAFQGCFLNESEQASLLSERTLKNYNAPEYGYLTSEYQKWLVVLHLFVKQQYSLLLKYLQQQIFACEDDLSQFLLRYNVALLYLLLGDHPKALNVFKGLLKYEDKFDVRPHLTKLIRAELDPDECLPDLREEIGIGCNKLLSSYLPYRGVILQEGLKVYARILVPFPTFQAPSLRLTIDHAFIRSELTPSIVQKRIDAPWIKKGRNRNIQFTQKLEDSVAELDDIANTADVKQLAQGPS